MPMRRSVLLILTATTLATANAQIVFHSVTDAWTAALKDNPTQKVYRLKTTQLTDEYKAEQSFLLPSVGAAFSGQDNMKLSVTPVPGELLNQPGKTLYLTFAKHYAYNAGFNTTETIFNWQSILLSGLARQNLRINDVQQKAYEQNLKTSTAQYYFTGLIAESSLRIATRDLQLADSILSTIRNRYDQGLADLGAVHSAEINVNNVQENILQSRQLHEQSIQNLKLLTGCTAQQTLTLGETITADSISTDTITSSTAITSATANAPLNPGPVIGPDKNLDTWSAAARFAELQAKFQKAAFYPTLSLNAFVGSQQFRDNFGMTFGDGAWNDYRYLQLNLNVPLFTGFYNRNKYRSAMATARIDAQQYRDAIQQSQINDSLLAKTYENYRLLVAASGRNLLLYRANVELQRQKFTEGLISIDTFQKTFEDYLRAENTHLNNLSALYSTLASIISRNS
jgi:outer membrane protein